MKNKNKNKKNIKLNLNNKNNFLIWVLLIIVVVSISNMLVTGGSVEKFDVAKLRSHIDKGTIEEIHCTGKVESDCK